ncbi:hypothetical protein CO172_03920 [Candidatus Uhrbacteria bacterium CG_4_9_14_3_um_filter_36_7]|uniref:NlpC/P60 domain-containing protein n=1 Tax=Candidatus Uhrbacteria bacterium CG_4_9_14_3_um_filter_36_7 TaxID=1975033 RepID=A0A2M7XEJ1_9BACT|nr:MAG: hypothetical protein CO172_03920 [Candidatus Uhrbacteria bacterium CG_4_9_14_3_um_filter_36_7]
MFHVKQFMRTKLTKKIINKSKKITPLIFKTYICLIEASIGCILFRHFYVKINAKQKDIMQNGELSCAFYVSSILNMFQLIDRGHVTVDSTVSDLLKFGWKKTKKLRKGSIIVWEPIDFGKTGVHKHIGFYIGNSKAISNDSKKGFPAKHSWNFNGERKVEMILWNSKLGK